MYSFMKSDLKSLTEDEKTIVFGLKNSIQNVVHGSSVYVESVDINVNILIVFGAQSSIERRDHYKKFFQDCGMSCYTLVQDINRLRITFSIKEIEKITLLEFKLLLERYAYKLDSIYLFYNKFNDIHRFFFDGYPQDDENSLKYVPAQLTPELRSFLNKISCDMGFPINDNHIICESKFFSSNNFYISVLKNLPRDIRMEKIESLLMNNDFYPSMLNYLNLHTDNEFFYDLISMAEKNNKLFTDDQFYKLISYGFKWIFPIKDGDINVVLALRLLSRFSSASLDLLGEFFKKTVKEVPGYGCVLSKFIKEKIDLQIEENFKNAIVKYVEELTGRNDLSFAIKYDDLIKLAEILKLCIDNPEFAPFFRNKLGGAFKPTLEVLRAAGLDLIRREIVSNSEIFGIDVLALIQDAISRPLFSLHADSLGYGDTNALGELNYYRKSIEDKISKSGDRYGNMRDYVNLIKYFYAKELNNDLTNQKLFLKTFLMHIMALSLSFQTIKPQVIFLDQSIIDAHLKDSSASKFYSFLNTILSEKRIESSHADIFRTKNCFLNLKALFKAMLQDQMAASYLDGRENDISSALLLIDEIHQETLHIKRCCQDLTASQSEQKSNYPSQNDATDREVLNSAVRTILMQGLFASLKNDTTKFVAKLEEISNITLPKSPLIN